MRILLINSTVSRGSPHSRLSPPLGLAYIAGHLRRAGHEVNLVDLNVGGYNPQRLRLLLKRVAPDLVGISTFTETYPNALEVARVVKSFDPAIGVALGGAHASILPLDALAEPEVNYVIIGEGEGTTAELVVALEQRRPLSGIAGLGWKRADGAPIINDPRPLLEADEVGRPARDLLSLEFYSEPYTVLTARGGCPYRCPFCSASHIWGGTRRPRSPQAVVDELEYLTDEYGAQHVFFNDDIFTLRREWVAELMTELERLRTPMTWSCSTRVDRVDEALLESMAAHGCTGIQFGIESGAQEILDSVKGIDKQAAVSAVQWAVKAGIGVAAAFMVPFPQDTEETLRETFGFAARLRDDGAEIMMSYTTPYPGTEFHDRAEEFGLRILTRDWGQYDAKHPVIDTAHFTADELVEFIETEAANMGLKRIA